MILENTLPIASSLLGTAGFILSIWNFWRTSRLADRQLALSLSRPLLDWAGELILLYEDICSVPLIGDVEFKKRKLLSLSAKCGMALSKRLIVLSYTDRHLSNAAAEQKRCIQIVLEMANSLGRDAVAESHDVKIDLIKYGDLLGEFCAQIINEMRASALAL